MNILLTSVGRRSYLVGYFQEALAGSGKVHVANSSEISPAFPGADAAVVTPLIYDGNYIPFLLTYCKKNDINAIISFFDIDLPVLSKNSKAFMDIGVTVVVSSPEVTDICNDKWKTFHFLTEHGFSTPKTFLSLEHALDALKNSSIRYPLMIKPRWGMGSISILEAENEQELIVLYKKAKRNIQKTYLKYESSSNIEESVLIQEKLTGQEHGLDIINDLKGRYQTTICKLKYAMRSGETDCAVTIDSKALRETGHKLSGILNHIGNLDVDIFMVNGTPYVVEMNARFGGGYPFSHVAGVNLPLAIVKWLKGEEIKPSILQPEIGIMAAKDISMLKLNSHADRTYTTAKNPAAS